MAIKPYNLTTVRKRLDAWGNLLTASQLAQGKVWYHNTHMFAQELSTRYNVTLEQAVGVIACLSVQNRWDVNKRDAENLCRANYDGLDLDGVIVVTYDGQKRKAIAILKAKPQADIASMVATRYGPKTQAFYSNILNPESSYRVTLDRWVFRGLDLEQFARGAGNRYVCLYRKLEELFREAAIRLALQPCQLQAAVWICIQMTADAEQWDGSRPTHKTEVYSETGDSIAPF
jgi:hypothetical protein